MIPVLPLRKRAACRYTAAPTAGCFVPRALGCCWRPAASRRPHERWRLWWDQIPALSGCILHHPTTSWSSSSCLAKPGMQIKAEHEVTLVVDSDVGLPRLNILFSCSSDSSLFWMGLKSQPMAKKNTNILLKFLLEPYSGYKEDP